MLRLRPYKPCDAQKIATWFQDPLTMHKWCASTYTYPLTATAINAYYDSRAQEEDFFQMTAFDESGAVGHLFMKLLEENKRTVRFGFVVVDSSKRGMGYGKAMLQLAISYAFEQLKAERITLGVFENNPSAMHCYQSLGFQPIPDSNGTDYPILGESWHCLELELKKETLTAKKQ